ncbi:MAG: hypothetical protein ABFR53_01605 [Actinomycetota bacterium]
MTHARLATFTALGALIVALIASPTSESQALTVEGGTTEQQMLAAQVLDRFAMAGLELPPIAIEFVGPSLEACGGARARAHLDWDPITVSVCWGDEFVLLHELAHVWTFGAVTEKQEVVFMGLRANVHAWADPADRWADQGREHAANVVAWGLMEDPQVVGRTYPNDRASLVEAFTVLTKTQPLHAEGGGPVLVDRTAFTVVESRPMVSGR